MADLLIVVVNRLCEKGEYYQIRSGSSDPPPGIEIENKTHGQGADGTIKDQDSPT